MIGSMTLSSTRPVASFVHTRPQQRRHAEACSHTQRLSAPRAVAELTPETFDQEVLQASGPVLVDFWADWCGPCKLMHPLMAQLQDEFGDSLKVVKVDCDQNPDAVEKYEVYGLPTLVLFRDGKEVEGSKREGAIAKAGIISWMEGHGVSK